MREETLFLEAVQMPAAQQQAFLAAACDGDLGLRQRVARLLDCDERARGILDRGPLSMEPHEDDAPPIAEAAGDTIGNYKLKEQIGEGGFGLVFVAEQQQPVRRKVALKIIKPGMDSKEIIGRFEAERQALAIMDHPNIARVFDAGTTASGRPYFVMELVRGQAITTFCDQQRFSTQQRLALFTAVCHAVQHAHQKGIIHRDLKPSNVLVTLHDGEPVVKVIDFGVAKALHEPLTDQSIYTRFAQFIGTPAYMSPEQAEFSGLDVDTRTDIYSLGVLLYEMLTGSTPFDRHRLAVAGLDEIRRIIREEEPPKPSTRISHAGETLVELAAQRSTEPVRLASTLRGDLDWIVMKALEKDRTRRYPTANGFARDVQRYLHDEPVEASPPSRLYRWRKLARRHRGALAAGTAILLLLVAGIVGTSWGLVKALHREREAADALKLANQRKQESDNALGQANLILRFLNTDLLMQAGSGEQADTKHPPNPKLTVREALDRAAASVGRKFAAQPLIEASIRTTIGQTYLDLGLTKQAKEQFLRALELRRNVPEAEPIQTLNVMHFLALAHGQLNEHAEALPMLEAVRDGQARLLPPDHPDRLTMLNNLAATYRHLNRTAQAFALFEEVYEAKRRAQGPRHPSTLATLHNLATFYADQGKLDEAIRRYELVLETKTEVQGAEHPETLITQANLAATLWQAKRLDESIPLFEKLVAANRKVAGDSHPNTINCKANLGVNYRDAGKLDQGIALLEEAHRQGGAAPVHAWIHGELLLAYQKAGKVEPAKELVRHHVAALRRAPVPKPKDLANALQRDGAALGELGQWPLAEPLLREAFAIRQQTDPDHWTTFNLQSLLGEALSELGDYKEAGPLLREGYAGLVARQAKIPDRTRHLRLQVAAARLERHFNAAKNAAEAEKWKQERQRWETMGTEPGK